MKLSSAPISGPWSDALARTVDRALREVREVLNGGLRLADQGTVRAFAWNTTLAPVRVDVGARPPVGLLVLRAVDATGAIVSGAAISWTWDGRTCSVSAIDGLASATNFDVTVFVVEG